MNGITGSKCCCGSSSSGGSGIDVPLQEDLLPAADDSVNLGGPTKRFKGVYSVDVHTTNIDATTYTEDGTPILTMKPVGGSGSYAAGANAGASLTTGPNNLVLGDDAFTDATVSEDGVYIGHNAGQFVFGVGSTRGFRNTVVGSLAGTGADGATDYHNCTAIGYKALTKGIKCNYDTCIGSQAGQNIVDAGSTTCVGWSAGNSITNASFNTCIGRSSDVTSGSNSTAIGNSAVCDDANQVTLGNTAILYVRPGSNGIAALGDPSHKFGDLWLNQRAHLGQYTVATLPPVATAACIYVSDDAGGPTLAWSDGVTWMRVRDNATVV